MRATLTAILVGTLLSLFAFAPSGNTQNQIGAQKKEQCVDNWAFPECNEGLARCSTLGATCYWCDTPSGETVKNCEASTYGTCTINIGSTPAADCGDRKQGTCVDNQQGGYNCSAVPVGSCGDVFDRC